VITDHRLASQRPARPENFNLTSGSPCVDKGELELVSSDLSIDHFENNIEGLPDIGAIEYQITN